MHTGDLLRQAREARGLSLNALAYRTKINPRLLIALEEGRLDAMPRGIFVRGYLRAYAGEVGLDPETVVEQYLSELGEPPPATGHAAPTAVLDTSAAPILLHTPVAVDTPTTSIGSIATALALAGFALAIVTFLSMRNAPASGPIDAAAQGAVPTTGLIAETPSAAEVAATTGAEPTAPAGGIVVTIFPNADCWVEAVADDRTRLYRLMRSGEREALAAEEFVTLRVGDPDAFAFAVNGLPGRVLGNAGQPMTVRITPQNYLLFVEPER